MLDAALAAQLTLKLKSLGRSIGQKLITGNYATTYTMSTTIAGITIPATSAVGRPRVAGETRTNSRARDWSRITSSPRESTPTTSANPSPRRIPSGR